MSYAESLQGYVKSYKLATLVEESTAGANGNINYICLLGDCKLSFPGLKVTYPDGSGYHLEGIQPDPMIHRSFKGIKEKRDNGQEKQFNFYFKENMPVCRTIKHSCIRNGQF